MADGVLRVYFSRVFEGRHRCVAGAKMLALHDVAEIEVGDTFHFDKSADSDAEERSAAKGVFDMLPAEQAKECL